MAKLPGGSGDGVGVCRRGAGSGRSHWIGDELAIDCTSQCHVAHNAQGGQLGQAADNVNLCQSCHNSSGLAQELSIDAADMAIPDVSGIHHAFDVAAVNASFNTQRPSDTQMDLRVIDDNIVCSTCHNQHKAQQAFGGNSRVAPSKPTVDLGGTGNTTRAGRSPEPRACGTWSRS